MSKVKSRQELEQQIRTLQSELKSLKTTYKEKQTGHEQQTDHSDRFRIMAEQTGHIFYDYDIPGGHLSWWGAIHKVLGYTEEAFADVDIHAWKDLLHPEDRDSAVENLEHSIRTGGSFYSHYRLRHRKGHYIPVQERGQILCDQEGPAYRMLGAIQDVSLQCEVQSRLQENEAKYRFYINNAPYGIFVLDRDGTLLDLNTTLCDLLGRRMKEIQGTRLSSCLCPTCRNDLNDCLEALQSRDQVIRESKICRKDGTTRAVRIVVRSLDPGHYLGFFRDIQKEWETREALIASENRFRTLIESIPSIAVRGYDSNHQIIFWNSASENLYGYKQSEVLGKTIESVLIPKETQDESHRAIEEWLQYGYTRPPQYVHLVHKNGTRIPVYSNYVLLTNAHGQTECYCLDIDLSDLEETRSRLDKEHQMLLQLINTLPNEIYIKDRQSRFLLNNEASLAALGQTHQKDVIGKTDFDFLPSETAQHLMETEQEIMRSGIPLQDRETLSLDRTTCKLNTKVPFYDIGGEMIGLIGISTDITQQKKTEQALRESERIYHLTIDAIEDMICVVDRDHRILLYNKSLLEFNDSHGLETKCLNRRLQDLYPFITETNPGLVNHVFRTGQPIKKTIKKNYNNNTLDIEVLALPILEDGQTSRVLLVSRDITLQLQAKERIEQIHKVYRATIENALGIPYLHYYGDDHYEFMSHSCESILGISREDISPDSLKERIIETEISVTTDYKSQEDYARAFCHGETSSYRMDFKFRRPDGTHIWLSDFAVPIQDEQTGAVIGSMGILQDISDRKRTAEELESANTQLENALQRERHLGRLANQANKAKSDFLATMSHEIRTPLNAIIGMTSLLLDSSLADDQKDYVDTIRKAGDSFLVLINDILDFSKIEAGKLELENQKFSLQDTVESAIDLIAPRAADKGLEIGYIIENNVPLNLIGDITRIRQIIVNLLNNAVKFTRAGEISVYVKSETSSSDDPQTPVELLFSVADTGIGIPRDRLNRLFRPFSQVDPSTTRRYGGTGLGLAISRHLAELMGGTLWVESTENKGSTFHVSLQVTRDPDSPNHSPSHCPFKKRRIILIEKENITRRMIEHYSHRWGIVCETADTVKEFETKMSANLYDAVIMNTHGAEWSSRQRDQIQQSIIRHNIPGVVLSTLGHGQMSDVTCVLQKPVKPLQLYTIYNQLFTESRKKLKSEDVSGLFDTSLGERYPLHILLVEDNMVNQKVALAILNRLGYRADTASNGIEAVEACKRQQYDVVLMDIQMPQMDGMEATQHIRTHQKRYHRPHIIALTAHVHDEQRRQFLNAGMDGYMRKPIQVTDLTKALKTFALRKHKAQIPAE